MFKKIFAPWLWGNLIAMVALAIALFLGAMFCVQWYTHHGEVVVVPNLHGMNYAEAEAKLDDLGLNIEVVDTGYVKTLPADAVLDQDLPAGREVKPGRTLHVVINSAHPRAITLPDIADNCSLREAEAKLKAIGFQLDSVERINGDLDWVYAIKVNGRNMPAGTRIFVDQKLTLVVGNGVVEEEFNGNDSLDYLYFAPPEPEVDETDLMDEPIDAESPNESAQGGSSSTSESKPKSNSSAGTTSSSTTSTAPSTGSSTKAKTTP